MGKPIFKDDGVAYIFSNRKFKDCYEKAYKEECTRHIGNTRFYKTTFQEKLLEKIPGTTKDNFQKWLSSTSPIDFSTVKLLAKALNCDVTSILDKCDTQAEDISIMSNNVNDREFIMEVYNQIVENIDIFVNAKDGWWFPKRRKEGEANPEVVAFSFIKDLTSKVYKNSLIISDAVINKLDRILGEMVVILDIMPTDIPDRWLDYTEWQVLELAMYLAEGVDIDSETSDEDIKKNSLYPYLEKRYPEVELHNYFVLYQPEVLRALYRMELSKLFRKIFLADFSDQLDFE